MDIEKDLKNAFQNAKYEEKSGLTLDIWNNLIIRNKRIALLKLWIFSIIGSFSLLGLIPASSALSVKLTQSGFYEYMSLVFSSNNSILVYWKELLLSITESLPIMDITLSLSLIFILLTSIKYTVKQIIINNYLTLDNA